MNQRLLIIPTLLLSCVAAPTFAQPCEHPAVMLTVDRSSSMLGKLPDGTTKWDAAVRAISELTAAYEHRIDFGLQPFPYPDRCEPGPVLLEMGPRAPGQVIEALGLPPPSGGNYTPMAETLALAAEHPGLVDPTRRRHLVLITDGWQWCDPHMPENRFTPVAAVMRLRELGVIVHVVGFGAAVDSLTLNRAALAAGTALPGCDPNLRSPREPNHCYLQSNDLGELRAALSDIGERITGEICDALDNDCDGLIDEGFDLDGDGFSRCATPPDCDDDDMDVHPLAPETCDGIDNDCDGATDVDCRCVEGAEMPCGSDVGACVAGMQRCVRGSLGACEEEIGPRAETCDGVDEDCDGIIDEHADASCGARFGCTIEGCVELVAMPPDASTLDPSAHAEERAPRRRGAHDGCACVSVGVGVARHSHGATALFFVLVAGLRRALRHRQR